MAHRGASGYAPENTMAAFELAVQLGADGIEFDLQRSRDGRLVIFHDEDLKRTTNIEGSLPNLTFDELRKADSGEWFGEAFRGERIPSIEELFDFFRGNDLILAPELKEPSFYPGIEEQVAQVIRAYGFEDRTQVRSFDHDALHRFYKVAPEISISDLWRLRMPNDDEVHYKTIDILFALYTEENLQQIHARGQQATAWVVNDMEAAQNLIAWGIDSIATDYPDQVLALME